LHPARRRVDLRAFQARRLVMDLYQLIVDLIFAILDFIFALI
jgi:hypothetical protein